MKKIRDAFLIENFRFTKHGLEQRIKRNITGSEINQAIQNGEMIEDYPNDKYGPSCLIYGQTNGRRPLHIQIAFKPIISVVTVYQPNPEEWIDFKVRRR